MMLYLINKMLFTAIFERISYFKMQASLEGKAVMYIAS